LRADGPAAALESVPPLLEPGQDGPGAAAAPGATNSAEPRAPPSDEVMLAIQVNPLYVKNRVDATERASLAASAAKELRALAAFFAAAASSDASLPAPTSLLVQYHFGVSNAAPSNAPLMPLEKAAADFDAVAAGREDGGDKDVAGPPPPANAFPGAPSLTSGPGSCADDPLCLHESLCDLRFRISPAAFFQVNAPATCLLYRLVGDFAAAGAAPASDGAAPDASDAAAAASPNCQLLLDVCCGTGTIGVSLSDRAARVYGVDSSAPAVEDAKRNAAANASAAGRCEFVCATAESALPPLLRDKAVSSLPPGAVVAVADPPRVGLHKNVLRALLAAPAVRRLVLVSCNPASLSENLVELCRPAWSRARGEAREGDPFRPVLSVAVDLFPHTRHVEAVVLLER
jgi:SAM-dependent methyltransferase